VTTVLDTSVVSAVMRRDPAVLVRLEELAPGSVWLPSPVAAEIGYGIARLDPRARRRQLLEREYHRLRRAIQWRDWDEAAARTFGEVKALLEHRGEIIEDMDIAIASVALVLGARLATRNVRHFSRVTGLDVEDWSA
jgi:tRNA(fMet)-specific endonuclease VapC